MAQVTEEKLDEVVVKLWGDLYEQPFRGKDRGRFAITRNQLRNALDVEKLHASTVERLQERALARGLVIIDLDDLFPCIETKIVRKYRRPTKAILEEIFGAGDDNNDDASDEEE